VPVTPSEVLVRHVGPRSIAAHKAWFGCPVRFDAEYDAILYADETLDRPNILGDEGISRYLISHLDADLSRTSDAPEVMSQARDAIAKALS